MNAFRQAGLVGNWLLEWIGCWAGESPGGGHRLAFCLQVPPALCVRCLFRAGLHYMGQNIRGVLRYLVLHRPLFQPLQALLVVTYPVEEPFSIILVLVIEHIGLGLAGAFCVEKALLQTGELRLEVSLACF